MDRKVKSEFKILANPSSNKWKDDQNHIHFKKIICFLIGLIALVWFLLRVIPKPQRASYPCQRAAFPLATGFVIWITGFLVTWFSVKRLKYTRKRKCSFIRIPALVILILTGLITQLFNPVANTYSSSVSGEKILKDINNPSSLLTLPAAEVSIVRSGKSKATDIDEQEILSMVREAVVLAGGFDDLIRDNDVVVLKPNLVIPGQEGSLIPFRKEVNGVTTDYRIIGAVAELVREKNPHGKIIVMEESAFGRTIDNMRDLGWLDLENIDEFIAIEDSSGAMRDYNSIRLVKKSLPVGINLFKSVNNQYYLNKTYYEADVLISLPVLKTHETAAFTGAIKNLSLGAMPASIYGDETGETNLRWPFLDHTSSFESTIHDWINDYYICKKADFVVMDALTGLENGPGIGKGVNQDEVRKNTRCIIAGKDAVAVDAIGALAVQVNPSRVRYLNELHKHNVGCADPRYIRVKGIRLDEIHDTYRNKAGYANYFDFIPPQVNLISYGINDDTLNLELRAEAQLIKMEVSVNDTILDQIYTTNFGNMNILLGRKGIRPEEIILYAYDSFLNCNIIRLAYPSGINHDNAYNPEINTYPNPCTGNITITLSNGIPERAKFILYDLSGRLLRSYSTGPEANPQSVTFDLHDLKPGTYLIKYVCGNKVAETRIVKK